MPIYSFQCDDGHTSDQIVPMGTQVAVCPVCQKIALRRQIEIPARRNPAYGIQ